MYITFLIGNGFDLNLGLKTKYRDFLEVYTSKSNVFGKELAATAKQ